jgi:hypothetical protein
MTKDQTSAHNTITLEKFAKRVTNAVGRFLDVSTSLLEFSAVTVDFYVPGILVGAGGPASSGAGSKLASWRRRDHEGGRHPRWDCSCLARKLAADPAIESFCGATMPAHPRIAVVAC